MYKTLGMSVQYGKSSRGFTLIELLVVIAIIGVLSSVVLASLSLARTKAKSSLIKSQLSAMRTAAELIYDSTGTYDSVCLESSDTGRMFRNAFSNGTQEASGNAACLSSSISNSGSQNSFMTTGGVLTYRDKIVTPQKWAASLRLHNGNFFCVDYRGIGQEQPSRGIDSSPLDMEC